MPETTLPDATPSQLVAPDPRPTLDAVPLYALDEAIKGLGDQAARAVAAQHDAKSHSAARVQVARRLAGL